jgi:putative transposase
MRKRRFSDEQIIGILKQGESGIKVQEICRQHGISRHTYYVWRSKYGGLSVDEAKRMRLLEDENRRLKQLVADLTLDKQALTAALGKKW